MDFLEAKCRAGVDTMTRIFEESHKCKIPDDVKEEVVQNWIEGMKPIKKWLEAV